MDKCVSEQQFISQQVKANGQAIAHLTLRQFEEDAKSQSGSSVSVIFEEEDPFTNVFAGNKEQRTSKPNTSKFPRYTEEHEKRDSLPHHMLPKMQFPKFECAQPKIWINKCHNYFSIQHSKVSVGYCSIHALGGQCCQVV